jgi:flagellar basal-body rod protein FlgF
MGGIAEIGGSIISRSQAEAATISRNMANALTPGYRAQRAFATELVPEQLDLSRTAAPTSTTDFTAGKLMKTGNPFDLAIQGDGFFTLRAGEQTFYTRSGQFSVDKDGLLVTSEGWVLQGSNGAIQVPVGKIEVAGDGTVVANGSPVARLAIVRFTNVSQLHAIGGASFEAPAGAALPISDPNIAQGMLESSNVTNGTEMVELMAALRRAEGGQRVVQLYDDLMNKAISGFDVK